jgi:predicted secreted protein
MADTTSTELLRRHDACIEAIEWVGCRTLPGAWRECPNGAWSLWWAHTAGAPSELVTRAACTCVRLVLPLEPAGSYLSRECVETAEAYWRGEAMIQQVREAADAARDLYLTGASVASYVATASWAAAYTILFTASQETESDYRDVRADADYAIDYLQTVSDYLPTAAEAVCQVAYSAARALAMARTGNSTAATEMAAGLLRCADAVRSVIPDCPMPQGHDA